MLTEAQRKSLVRSWKLVVPIAETAADLFYRRLFELRPEYRSLFSDDMGAQKRKLLRMLAFVVRSVDWVDTDWRENIEPEDDLMLVVLALGKRHRELYQVPDQAYEPVGEALLWTLEYGLGDAFTDDVRKAWTELYGTLSTAMRMSPAVLLENAGLDEAARLADRDTAERGEAILASELAEAGIDEARMGFGESRT